MSPATEGSGHNGCFMSRNSGQFYEEEIEVFVNGTEFSLVPSPTNWSSLLAASAVSFHSF